MLYQQIDRDYNTRLAAKVIWAMRELIDEQKQQKIIEYATNKYGQSTSAVIEEEDLIEKWIID